MRQLSRNVWTIVVVAFLLAGLLAAFPWTATREVFEKQGIVVTGPPNVNSFDSAANPTVFEFTNGTHMMWYTSIDFRKGVTEIRAATSADGLHWWPMGVAIPLSTGPWNLTVTAQPTVMSSAPRISFAPLDMWFLGIPASHQPAIYHASGDGYTWNIDGVAYAPANGSWDAGGVYTPSVVWDGNEYRMYYTAQWNGENAIGLAQSLGPLGFVGVGNRPVLVARSAGSWDAYGVLSPDVMANAGAFTMYYEGESSNSAQLGSVGVATSQDGTNWTEDSANPVLTPSPDASDWDSMCICGGVLGEAEGRGAFYYTGTGMGATGTVEEIGVALLTLTSVPAWSFPPVLGGFLVGVAVSVAVVVRVTRPWARSQGDEAIVLDGHGERLR